MSNIFSISGFNSEELKISEIEKLKKIMHNYRLNNQIRFLALWILFDIKEISNSKVEEILTELNILNKNTISKDLLDLTQKIK